MPPQAMFDYHGFNYDKPLFDIHAIRKFNPQEPRDGVAHTTQHHR